MSQNSLTLTCQQSGTQFTTKLNEALDSVDSCHSGSAAPTLDLVNGKLWLDTSSADYVLKMYIGTSWVSLFNYDGTNFQSEHAQEADVLTTPRNLSLQGDATGTFANFDGSGNLSATIDVNTSAKLDVARTISLSGDLAGSITFDGSADKTLTATIQADSIDLAMMTDNSVDTSEIVDGAITLAKLDASEWTKGDILVGNDSGNPELINGTAGQSLVTTESGGLEWGDAPQANAVVRITSGGGSWSVPTGVTKVWVDLAGGGGSGGTSSGGDDDPFQSCGAGGGGAAHMTKQPYNVTSGGAVTYSIGSGGAAVSVAAYETSYGNAGGNTTFGTLSAGGGGGGAADQTAGTCVGGSGGTYSGGVATNVETIGWFIFTSGRGNGTSGSNSTGWGTVSGGSVGGGNGTARSASLSGTSGAGSDGYITIYYES